MSGLGGRVYEYRRATTPTVWLKADGMSRSDQPVRRGFPVSPGALLRPRGELGALLLSNRSLVLVFGEG